MLKLLIQLVRPHESPLVGCVPHEVLYQLEVAVGTEGFAWPLDVMLPDGRKLKMVKVTFDVQDDDDEDMEAKPCTHPEHRRSVKTPGKRQTCMNCGKEV